MKMELVKRYELYPWEDQGDKTGPFFHQRISELVPPIYLDKVDVDMKGDSSLIHNLYRIRGCAQNTPCLWVDERGIIP